MARLSDRERIRDWHRRLAASGKVYEKWSDQFRTERLMRYWLGLQWPQRGQDNERYVINLFYAATGVKMPSMLFHRPRVHVKPRPTRIDDPFSGAETRARLREDVVNTFIEMDWLAFKRKTSLALKESFWRYGVIEVGYTADYIDNPHAAKPTLDDTGTEDRDSETPSRIVDRERLFLKWIPANTFRVSINAGNELEEADWCAYFEWHYPADVKRNERYSNTSSVKATGRISNEYIEAFPDKDDDDRHKGMVKVWKLWDMREHKRRVFQENGEKFLLEESFEFLPLSVLRFDEIPGQWLPLPPMFNWLSPQDELNDIREMQRIHRRRFKRRWLAVHGRITTDELSKLENADDGAVAWATGDNAILPVPDAPLDPTVVRNIPMAKDDFDQVSGTTAEQKGLPETETATQANLIDIRARIRESEARVKVGEWLSDIARVMLRTIETKMGLPIWVKTAIDPLSPGAPIEAAGVEATWQQITDEDLGDLDYEVSVDVESLSPVTEATERSDWTALLTVLGNTGVFSALAMSETLLRKTLGMYGIRNEKEIKEIQRIGQVMMMAQATPPAGEQPRGVGGARPTAPQGNAAIASQLVQQIPTGVV